MSEKSEPTHPDSFRGKVGKEHNRAGVKARDKQRHSQESAPPPFPATRYDLQVLQSLRQIIRAVDIYSRKLVANHELTAPQLICLLIIVENGASAASNIAKQAYLSASTVVGILDRLEKKGLIHRLRDSNDRRVVNVSATEKGLELAYNAPSPLQDSLANALKQLSELEQSTIALSLKRIVDLMEAGHLEAAPILETDQPDQDRGHQHPG